LGTYRRLSKQVATKIGGDMKMEPILARGHSAKTVKVDEELILWARRVSGGREAMLAAYIEYREAGTTPDFVPCECGCGAKLKTGDQALVISWGTRKRIFASAQCQRANFVTTRTRYRGDNQSD